MGIGGPRRALVVVAVEVMVVVVVVVVVAVVVGVMVVGSITGLQGSLIRGMMRGIGGELHMPNESLSQSKVAIVTALYRLNGRRIRKELGK